MNICDQEFNKDTPVVVIVDGGFGGLAVAKALKRLPTRVTLIDRLSACVF